MPNEARGFNDVTTEDCYKKHEDINNALNDIKIKIVELPDRIMEQTDKRYASKLTEKVVYTMLSVVFLAVLSALVATVVRAF